jgi:hypothetical protein
MKAHVINASPNMDKGNTAAILGPFIDGMREAGAEIELFYSKKLRIQPCQGEMNCMLKTPGVCFSARRYGLAEAKVEGGRPHRCCYAPVRGWYAGSTQELF